MAQARRVLFISPVMPAETGHGLAMRAAMCLEALAQDHDVTLLVVPVAGPGVFQPMAARQQEGVKVIFAAQRGHRTAANDCHSSIQDFPEIIQQGVQFGAGKHSVGSIRKLHQRAVEVEEQPSAFQQRVGRRLQCGKGPVSHWPNVGHSTEKCQACGKTKRKAGWLGDWGVAARPAQRSLSGWPIAPDLLRLPILAGSWR